MINKNAAHHMSMYAQRMSAVAQEKAALLNHLPFESNVLDFGCANGSVAQAALQVRPDLNFVCHDLTLYDDFPVHPRMRIYQNAADAMRFILSCGGPKFLFLSSVMHEVISHQGVRMLDNMFTWAKRLDGVVIRDMAYRAEDLLETASPPPALSGTHMLKEFEERWGEVNNAVSCAHLMLKSRYEDNWSSELEENYFAFSVEQLKDSVSKFFPNITVFEHEAPSFLDNDLRRRYGQGLSHPTHVKMIAIK